MITDAKALFDSFHREGLSGNLVDKRTGLEILVLKERLGALNGTFRWMSSERQYADSLTKTGTRQLLADRLRYGKIKFTYDADYTAAKRKTKEEREKSRTEFTLAKADQPRALPEEDAAGPEEDPTFPTEGFAFSLNISYVDTLTFVPVELYSVRRAKLLPGDLGDSEGDLQADPEVCGQAPAFGALDLPADVPHHNFCCST